MNNATTQKTDAIVIGAGLGGLSCALHLAKRGMHVTVLEKQPKIGGYAQNYTRSGYDFDVSLHVLCSMSEGDGLRKLLDYLQVLPKLDIVEKSPMFTSVFPDATYQLVGGKDAADYLKSEFPGESAGIDKFIDIMRRLVGENGKLFWSGEFDHNNFFPARYFKKTYQQLLEECFTDPRLFGLLGQLWQSTGLPNELCAANWAAEVFGSHILSGNYYIRGGGQQLSNAMGRTLQEAGSVVRTGALVNRVLVKDKKAFGVELESGEQLHADVVVSNANPLQTYMELVGSENLAKPFIYKLGTLTPSCSLLTLYLGLDCPGSEAGITDHSTIVNHDYSMLRAYNDAMDEKFDQTDYLISDYTDDSSGCHRKGAGVAQVLEAVDGKLWTQIPRSEYVEKKARVTETILDKVSKRYPKLRQHIDVCETGTPRTMALATRNPDGAVYGWAQTPEQADNFRFGVASIFQGLYFTGAWARGGGGGYMGAIVNGRVASHQILARHGWNKDVVHFDTAAPQKEDGTLPIEKTTYNAVVEAQDISPAGELLPQSCVKIMSETADHYVKERKKTLGATWTQMDTSKPWSTTYFQMRFVFVPFVTIQAGDRIRVETDFAPGAPGKGEFTQNVFLEKNDKKLANAGGRVLIRV